MLEINDPLISIIIPVHKGANYMREAIDSVLSFYQKTHDIVKGAGYTGAKRYLFKIIEDYKQRDISKIKVSVIIPFFNRINWTIDAIKSVLAQTHKNLELIIVNDSSTDDIEPIRKLVENDNRIKLIQNERQKGVSGARNTGIDFAIGEYIAFLDSDDLFMSEKIEKQLKFMVRNGYLFTHTSYILFSNNKDKERVINSGKRELVYPSIIPHCIAATPTIMINSDILKNKQNRFEETFSIGEDTCFWIKLSKITNCNGLRMALTRVRDHGSNAAYDNLKQIQGIKNIFDYVTTNFSNQETIPYIKKLNRMHSSHINKTFGITDVFDYFLLKDLIKNRITKIWELFKIRDI
jgi:glycosyltransferase involved in cell wall biosynthesis